MSCKLKNTAVFTSHACKIWATQGARARRAHAAKDVLRTQNFYLSSCTMQDLCEVRAAHYVVSAFFVLPISQAIAFSRRGVGSRGQCFRYSRHQGALCSAKSWRALGASVGRLRRGESAPSAHAAVWVQSRHRGGRFIGRHDQWLIRLMAAWCQQ